MIKHSIILSFTFLLVACFGSNNEPINQDENQEVVLVNVGHQHITESDLEAMILRTIGEYGAFQLDTTGRQKILESMVLANAMSQSQQALMNEDEHAQINQKVAAYKEELLTKQYLKENVVAVPVSNAAVEAYYNNNKAKYGEKTIKTFEVIKGNVKLKGPAHREVLAAMKMLTVSENWMQFTLQKKEQDIPLTYSKGAVTKGALKSNIDHIIQNLALNQMSSVHSINGFPLIVKVVNEEKIQAKPLSQVSYSIRKTLAPLQLKKAIEKISTQLLKTINVEYVDPNEQKHSLPKARI